MKQRSAFFIITMIVSFLRWTHGYHLYSSRCALLWGQPLRVQQRLFRSSNLYMMPEGPEVRHLVDQLQPAIGQRLIDVRFTSGRYVRNGPPDGFERFASTMTKLQEGEPAKDANVNAVDMIQDWKCKGKFMYILLDDGRASSNNDDPDYQRSIWITLGMTGHFLPERALMEQSPLQQHVRWHLELFNVTSGKFTKLYYADRRNFGTLKFCLSQSQLIEKLSSLGPDILSGSLTESDFINILSQQRPDRNICKVLMDQSKFAGVGNYILSECLYRASIDPFCSISELDLRQQQNLFRQVVAVAQESYESQGSDDESDEEFEYQIYGQEKCRRNGEPVIKETNGPHGRTIWYTKSQLFVPRSKRADQTLESTSGKQTQSIPSNDSVPPRASGMSLVKGDRSRTETVATAQTPGNAKLAAIIAGGGQEVDSQSKPRATSIATRVKVPTEQNKKQLVESLLDTITDSDWKSALRDELIDSPTFEELSVFLEQERASGVTVYPPRHEIFSALNLCPLDSVKVVIVGQDPYHGPGQGHGLAFSVRKRVRPPPSLQNVFKEAMEDVGIETPTHGNLEHWARQGVLLLNTVLTVQEGKAFSHKGKGWEEVTDAIIRLAAERNQCADSSSLVFLLWGNAAFEKVRSAIGEENGHIIIRSSHPSPLGATKTSQPFLGSQCFSRANKALLEMGKDPIDWNVE